MPAVVDRSAAVRDPSGDCPFDPGLIPAQGQFRCRTQALCRSLGGSLFQYRQELAAERMNILHGVCIKIDDLAGGTQQLA